jgi:hypothetical protein
VSARLTNAERRWLRESCEKSGVPERITDPVELARAAELLRPQPREGAEVAR